MPNVENGRADVNEDHIFKTGHELLFSSNEGFSSPHPTTTCQATKTWSPQPVCEVTCKVPQLGNGRYTVMSGNRETNEHEPYNTWISPVCDDGYMRSLFTQRKCKLDGQWSGKEVNCRPIICERLPNTFANGSYDSGGKQSSFPYNYEITAVCHNGHYLQTPLSERRCIASNTWSRTYPECRRITCRSPDPFKDGQYIGNRHSYDFGTVLVPTCNTGYYMANGVEKRVCEQIDTWSGSDPQCRIVTCNTPNISNGHYDPLSSYWYNTTITIECNEGYEMKGGSATRTCQSDGTWGQPSLECVKILFNDTSDVRHEHIDHYPKLAISEIGSVSYNSEHIFLSSGHTEVTCSTSRKLKWIKAPQFGKLFITTHVHLEV